MFNFQLPNLGSGIFLLVIWEAVWKGIGLWKSAKKGDLIWFIAIFVINSVGLIPIIYLWRSKQLEPMFGDIQKFFKSKFKKQ